MFGVPEETKQVNNIFAQQTTAVRTCTQGVRSMDAVCRPLLCGQLPQLVNGAASDYRCLEERVEMVDGVVDCTVPFFPLFSTAEIWQAGNNSFTPRNLD